MVCPINSPTFWILLIAKKISYLLELYAAAAAAKSLQLCPTLCDPIDSSPPGSSVPGILEARILEWVPISLSRLLPQLFPNLRRGFRVRGYDGVNAGFLCP